MNKENPQVFISHATEDKERFVLKFSEYLLSKGINVWLDKWEMLPGDSLVDKIFEEGLKNASAVIVVLSKNSINKKWVKEELKAGVIKRINMESKLIPVVLDDLQREEIPQALQDTVWIKISDTNNYMNGADRIIAALTGQKLKPNIGKLPSYSTFEIELLPNLTKIDTLVHKTICDIVVKDGDFSVDHSKLFPELKTYEISNEEIIDSIKLLHGRNYIKAFWDSSGFSYVHVTTFGFEEYARKHISKYNESITAVTLFLVNTEKNVHESNIIAKSLGLPLVIVEHITDLFESQGFVNKQHLTGNTTLVSVISPELKRKVTF